ncbi:iron-siderophore ABC transporter substrate-binding protein [Candidatus Gracilibacteria bacterium]|nr:iron-siderophore ABC transporter substrate-binding protein [Candidatus Gracilibacteria bacterium]NJM90530.1 iron-siderophore ABC transporter substrate-binding protein [Hydrococcus sp. RU_2_2]NJP22355.1 iron-siderophore ABC transporter substrate-binding protein [Hydrococcus sp. CRU_1_1]
MFASFSLRRFNYLVLLSLLTVLLISACNITHQTNITSYKQPVENCRIVRHVMGSTCIPRNPQRVVDLAPDGLANSWALGIRPIASTYVAGFPMPKYLQGKVKRVESVGDFNSPNLEKILRLKPDLIISGSELKGIYKQLSYIAPTVVLNTPFPSPPWTDILEELATVLGKEEVGKQLIHNYWQRVEKLKQALGDRRKTMVVSIANTSSEYGIWSYGEKHFSGSVLKDIGLQRPKSQRGDFFYIENISKEKILDIDGDVLFFASWERQDDKKTLDKLKQSPLWGHLKVFQQNKVYFVGGHWHSSDIFAINAILDDLFEYLVNNP